MYNKEKFAYVEVEMDRNDYYGIEGLKENLESWCPHLYRATEDDKVVRYKGLMTLKEAYGLNTLMAASPEGFMYKAKMDGLDFNDHRNNKRFIPFYW